MEYQDNFEQFIKDKEKLNEKEMLELQEAVVSSKETATATEEDQQSESMKQSNKEKYFKNVRKGKNVSAAPKEFDFTFQDLVDLPFTPLESIYHQPVFALPINTNPVYKKYTVQERIQLMCNYHTKISEIRTKIAKTSLRMASWSKPISASNSLKYSLESQFPDSFEETPTRDFYVSRAGRQIKRKIYTEDEDGDSETEFVTSAKKSKAPDSDVKITFDSPFILEENNISKQSTPKVQNQDKNNTTQKPRKGTPMVKKTFVPHKKLTRAEQMFDEVKRGNSKKLQEEEEMAKFEQTLPEVDYGDDDFIIDNSPVKEVPVETFIRKRIIPPIPTKRTSKAKKQLVLEENKKTNETPTLSPPGSPILKRFERSKNTETASNSRTPKSKEENTEPKLQKQDCPICGGLFLVSEIENHASNCGIDDFEDFENIQQTSTNSNNSAPMTCATCDKVFLTGAIYNDHIKQCVASIITNL